MTFYENPQENPDLNQTKPAQDGKRIQHDGAVSYFNNEELMIELEKTLEKLQKHTLLLPIFPNTILSMWLCNCPCFCFCSSSVVPYSNNYETKIQLKKTLEKLQKLQKQLKEQVQLQEQLQKQLQEQVQQQIQILGQKLEQELERKQGQLQKDIYKLTLGNIGNNQATVIVNPVVQSPLINT